MQTGILIHFETYNICLVLSDKIIITN